MPTVLARNALTRKCKYDKNKTINIVLTYESHET